MRVAPRKIRVCVKEGQRVKVSRTIEKIALKNAYVFKICKIIWETARKSTREKKKEIGDVAKK